MKKLALAMLTVVGMALFMVLPAKACTSYYVGKDCAKDGYALYGRTEDLSSKKDKVYKVIDAAKVPTDGIWKDESGATTFQAPLKKGLKTTYRYTICRDAEGTEEVEGDGYFGEFGTNSVGVSMSATTSAGVNRSVRTTDPYINAYEGEAGGITEENLVDYILCQASSAREGVEILADVIDTVGAGEGNGLFIADKNEVWYFEMLTGHNYCAIKLPDDEAAIIPNCLVIGDVDLSDTENVIASKNLVRLAKNNGFYVAAKEAKGDINVKLSYVGEGYSAGNADRIRGGQYLLTGQDNTAIYTDDYQDIFFSCKNVTVEKLYELAGYRYENMKFGRDVSRYIGVPSSMECHIFQLRPDMPTELATVQWVCMGSADFSTFVPFYGALLTDVPKAYKVEAAKQKSTSAYWTFRRVGFLCEGSDADRAAYGTGVKSFYKAYMKKMESLQKNVDKEMLAVYKNDKSNLEYYATKLGKAIGDETVEFARVLYADILNAKESGETYTTSSLSADDVEYDLSMVTAPKRTAETKKETATKKKTVTAPARVKGLVAKNKKGKKLKVKFKKVTGAKGYEIACSTSLNFTKKKTKTVKVKTGAKTIKKLKKKKTYYVKVRAYKMNGTKKVYGAWSYIRKVTIKK